MPDNTQKVSSWYVYIVECRDGSYYTGITTDIERRINEHNHSTLGSRYTRSRRPVKLCYSEASGSRSAALKRERQIKRLATQQKHQLVTQVAAAPANS